MVDCWQPPDPDKAPPMPDREGRLLSVGFVIALQAWARWIAAETGCQPYLVGSALAKRCPRDVDVALVWPDAEYEQYFGPIPRSLEEYEARWRGPFQSAAHAFSISAWQGVGYVPRIDTHLFPECWWPDRPRLPLDGSIPPEIITLIAHFWLCVMVGSDGSTLFEWQGRQRPCL